MILLTENSVPCKLVHQPDGQSTLFPRFCPWEQETGRRETENEFDTAAALWDLTQSPSFPKKALHLKDRGPHFKPTFPSTCKAYEPTSFQMIIRIAPSFPDDGYHAGYSTQ